MSDVNFVRGITAQVEFYDDTLKEKYGDTTRVTFILKPYDSTNPHSIRTYDAIEALSRNSVYVADPNRQPHSQGATYYTWADVLTYNMDCFKIDGPGPDEDFEDITRLEILDTDLEIHNI